jgi:hypothetical protein
VTDIAGVDDDLGVVDDHPVVHLVVIDGDQDGVIAGDGLRTQLYRSPSCELAVFARHRHHRD